MTRPQIKPVQIDHDTLVRSNLPALPYSQEAKPSVDEFLETARLVLGSAISAQAVTGASRSSDMDLSSGAGEIIIRTTLPNGTQLEARRSLARHSLRWRRIWPYILFLIALATALLFALHGNKLIEIAQKLLLEIAK